MTTYSANKSHQSSSVFGGALDRTMLNFASFPGEVLESATAPPLVSSVGTVPEPDAEVACNVIVPDSNVVDVCVR